MANKIVRSIREVKDVNKLAQHVTTENDLVSTTEGTVYIVTKNGYEQITGGVTGSEITSLKSENTKLKNRVTELETTNSEQDTKIESLETSNSEQDTKITALETSNTDLISRIEALETPPE